jgi:hypothetical protein
VELSVTPPVDDSTERVLRTALQSAGFDVLRGRDDQGAWRLAGLQEGVERDDADGGYTPSPRSTRGATRA